MSKNCGLAPWEIENTNQQVKREVKRTAFTRNQWREKGRTVTVTNAQARRTVQTLSGHTLKLFEIDQTVEGT